MKFINLLKKELSELINKQMIITLVFMLGIFLVMGNVMKSATNEIVEDAQSTKVSICNQDDTDFTNKMLESFKSNGAEINSIKITGDAYASAFKDQKDLKSYILIPQGFADTVQNGDKPELLSISKVKSVTAFANITGGSDYALSIINSYVSQELADQQGVSKEQLKIIEDPLTITEHTVVADKSAKISASAIIGKVMMQNMLLPLVVIVLIMMTSQSLIASISNEKIDKTLETLLSAPVSRSSVITAKMLAAAIVALINAAVMMVGVTSYTKGMTGAVTSEIPSEAMSSLSTGDAFSKLGLQLGVFDYVMVGVQLFVTIMICLALSIILGALVNDSKSAQTMILPLVLMVMIPWMITMFIDINSLPTAAKIIIYAIPFTHTFTSIPNLMFGNMTAFWIGLGYQIAIFLIVMFFALKLFKSDKILTISLNFGQKSRLKKSRKTTED